MKNAPGGMPPGAFSLVSRLVKRPGRAGITPGRTPPG
jgi:hypothetical protein